MNPEVKKCLDQADEQMKQSLTHLEKEFSRIRAGKASPQMLENVFVDYYGTSTPLTQLANVGTPDAKTIFVQPWDKTVLSAVEKAIQAANLGFNPQNDGNIIRITVPPLTEERRKDLVKRAKVEAENAKVAIRNNRRDANEIAKKLQKNGVEEDSIKQLENEIQNLTNDYIAKVDKLFGVKEKDIMTV